MEVNRVHEKTVDFGQLQGSFLASEASRPLAAMAASLNNDGSTALLIVTYLL